MIDMIELDTCNLMLIDVVLSEVKIGGADRYSQRMAERAACRREEVGEGGKGDMPQ